MIIRGAKNRQKKLEGPKIYFTLFFLWMIYDIILFLIHINIIEKRLMHNMLFDFRNNSSIQTHFFFYM